MVVVDQYNKFIKLYQGELIDEATFEGRLLPYHNQKYFYLGRTGRTLKMEEGLLWD